LTPFTDYSGLCAHLIISGQKLWSSCDVLRSQQKVA